MSDCKCHHIDYALEFSQAPTNAGVCLRILVGFHTKNKNGDDMSDQHYLELLKNYYGTKDTATNCFAVLQKALEQRGFQKCTNTDPYLFTMNDCTIITNVDDCLIFHNNYKVLEDLIMLLKDEFQLTDRGDLDAFLGVLFKKHSYNKLEMMQHHLIQRIVDTLGTQDESKMHDAHANATLNLDEN